MKAKILGIAAVWQKFQAKRAARKEQRRRPSLKLQLAACALLVPPLIFGLYQVNPWSPLLLVVIAGPTAVLLLLATRRVAQRQEPWGPRSWQQARAALVNPEDPETAEESPEGQPPDYMENHLVYPDVFESRQN